MNIETSKVNTRKTNQKNQQIQQPINDSSIKFTDELNIAGNPAKKNETVNKAPMEENLSQNTVEPTVQKEIKETEPNNLGLQQKTSIEKGNENDPIVKETEAINLLKETVESVKAELPEKHIQKNNNTLNTNRENLSIAEVNANTPNKKIKNPFIEENFNKKPNANSQKETNNLTENTNISNVNSSIKNQPQKPAVEIVQPELNKEPQKEIEILQQNKPIVDIIQPELNKEQKKEIEIPQQNKPVVDIIQPELNKEQKKEIEILSEVKPKPQPQIELKENLEYITD